MNKLTFTELEKILNSEIFREFDHHPSCWVHENVCDNPSDVVSYFVGSNNLAEFETEFAKLGEFEMVEQHGRMDEGSDYYTIYHFKDHDIYIQFQGWYASHEGSEYEGMFEVKPKEVTVTEYNQV